MVEEVDFVWRKNMATYREIQQYIRDTYHCSVKTCWIAHMKEICGLPVRIAPNRIDVNNRTNECPPDKRNYIDEAFRHFHMI